MLRVGWEYLLRVGTDNRFRESVLGFQARLVAGCSPARSFASFESHQARLRSVYRSFAGTADQSQPGLMLHLAAKLQGQPAARRSFFQSRRGSEEQYRSQEHRIGELHASSGRVSIAARGELARGRRRAP
jgi:hypothetical protein